MDSWENNKKKEKAVWKRQRGLRAEQRSSFLTDLVELERQFTVKCFQCDTELSQTSDSSH